MSHCLITVHTGKFLYSSIIHDCDGGMSRRTRRSEIRQRSADATEGTDLPNVFQKNSSLTVMPVKPIRLLFICETNVDIFN